MAVQIKIDGITRPEDAALLAEFGATHLACILDPESRHHVSPARAKELAQAAGRKIKLVLSFRNPSVQAVIEAAKEAGTRHVQLASYREPDAQLLEKAGLVVYRVYEVPSGVNLLPPILPEPTEKAPAILHASASGAGLTFPWEILGAEAPHATFISGGVRPENVCALLTHHPYGIAINAGIEREPGVKDPDRLALFFETIAQGV